MEYMRERCKRETRGLLEVKIGYMEGVEKDFSVAVTLRGIMCEIWT